MRRCLQAAREHVPGRRLGAALLMAALTALSGCAAMDQARNTVLVRLPGEPAFDADKTRGPADLAATAARHWELAVMSENAYHASAAFPTGARQLPMLDQCTDKRRFPLVKKQELLARADPRSRYAEFTKEGAPGEPLLQGWTEWEPFLSAQAWCDAVAEGVAFRVYEKTVGDVTSVVISFRGTVFEDAENWRSSVRLVLPADEEDPDANQVVQYALAPEFAAELLRRHPDKAARAGALEVVTTGHSLGGALAQQLAHAYPPADIDLAAYPSLRVRRVVVFDPSPANALQRVPESLRARNAGKLPVTRVFQDGEALSYLRASLGYLYPVTNGDCDAQGLCQPIVEEVRYAVRCSPELYSGLRQERLAWLNAPVNNHKMQLLACGIATAAGHPPADFRK